MPKFTVLIIEDEKNIQTFVGKILKKQDCRDLGSRGNVVELFGNLGGNGDLQELQ